MPFLLTGIGQRLYLHFVNPETDLYIAGYNVHHLYTGCLLMIPAAFLLAFPTSILLRIIALVLLGIGSSMVLDEVIFLIVTNGSNQAYLTRPSLWGAILLQAAAFLLLLALTLSTAS